MFGIGHARALHVASAARRGAAVLSGRGTRDGREIASLGFRRRWCGPALTLASTVLVASCMSTGQTVEEPGSALAPAVGGETRTAPTVTQPDASQAVDASSLPILDPPFPADPTAMEAAPAPSPEEGQRSADGSSSGGRRVSLRPEDNVHADDLLDHWGHRRNERLAAGWSAATASDDDDDRFEELLESARSRLAVGAVPGFKDGDAITVLGHHRGVSFGRWTGGPADTLSIAFDLEHATPGMREDRTFTAALDRAGKAWSWRIDDTWQAWERRWNESKGHLIGHRGSDGREIRVGPGGETSTGLVIYVTGPDLGEDVAGRGGPASWPSGETWEPHTGVLAFDRGFLEEATESDLFATAVHEIGHVIGSWLSEVADDRLAAYIDREAGTWTGPNVVAVHGGPAPFQDADDAHAWHGGERDPHAANLDYAHSGVCTSVMAYCGQSGGIPPFLPAEIDFAFLADLGLSIRPATDRHETYGLAGWLDHSAFTLSVSRDLSVSLANPQPRYAISGDGFPSLDTVDLLWARADAFGAPSTGTLALAHPLAGTVRYAGGLIGTAVKLSGFPPVRGDADLAVSLDTLTGKASFTSLRTLYDGEPYLFAGGSLYYPITVDGNAITYQASGVTLAGDFYGPGHQEVAGTLDDARAGLVASFGATHDARPARAVVIAEANHVMGMIYQGGVGETVDGWRRFRCGTGSACDGQFEWWEPDSHWYGVTTSEERNPRERVLSWTAGWGDWVSEDLFADRGGIRIARRSAHSTDGGTGRYQQDGYYGAMAHAAFGTGFFRFHDWEGQDGEVLDFYNRGSGIQGDLTGTRPAGGATWDGRMIGHQSGLDAGEDPFVQGGARVRVSFGSDRVDIAFSGLSSMDFEREVADFGFDDIPLSSDGTFEGFDEGHLEGAFFGPAHQEAAGMFHKNTNNMLGSFGATAQD